MTTVTYNIAQSILLTDTYDLRFEAFCCDALSVVEGGALVLPTSRSWDLGRDGRGGPGNSDLFVCATLRDDLDNKAIGDIVRLVPHLKNRARVYYCSTQGISEYRSNSIELVLEDEADQKIACTAYGSIQLATIAVKHPETFIKHYGAELRTQLEALASDIDPTLEEMGLRLALVSSAQSESFLIRQEQYEVILLEALMKEQAGVTLQSCGKAAASVLRLSSNLTVEAILPHLQRLVSKGLVSEGNEIYSLTDSGILKSNQYKTIAQQQQLEGKLSIRGALESSMAMMLDDEHFLRIWNLIEKRMTHHFASRGMMMVQEITELLEELDSTEVAEQSIRSNGTAFVDDLAREVGSTSRSPQQQKELEQSVKDLFRDRTGPAADWLVALSAAFISACSLGLEVTSADAITKLLGQITIVLDSDVALSLIGEGEPEHSGVAAIVRSWPKFGGRVLVAEPVLEEVAYHASIAQHDFDAVSSWLPGTSEERLRLIENVFVRSFAEIMFRKDARIADWRQFIDSFKGKQSRDWSRVYSVLSGDYSISKLPPRSTEEAKLEKAVREFLVSDIPSSFSGIALRNAQDKARRDAELYSAMVHFIRLSSIANPSAQCVLISSAHRLYLVEEQFSEISETHFVLRISVILQLLSLVPGVSLGLSALRAFLFEERRSGFSSDFERNVIRLVKSSREYVLPWAKRAQLTRVLRERLLTEAGKSADQIALSTSSLVERNAFQPSHRARTVELIAQSLDELAVDKRVEEEGRRARQELAAANEEIERLRHKLKVASVQRKKTN